MKVLVIGSGGREHALSWAIAKSPLLTKLYCAPGNGGMAGVGECVNLKPMDFTAILDFCRAEAIDFVVVGPEDPLAGGLVDVLNEAGIKSFGPSKAAAQLEASKSYTKDLCAEFGIPTAAYARFEALEPARTYLKEKGLPIVIKADGLAAGKGVIIPETMEEAEQALEEIFGGKFGDAGAQVVIEEFMTGEEASFFVLADGTAALPLATAQDHKRVGDGDTGPNTGGMGAYSPAPIMTPEMCERVMREIVQPTLDAMAKRGTPFKGVLFAGLMLTDEGPKLVEYNARFGDPETQVLMLRLKSDILPALIACHDGTLGGISLDWHDEAALTVVMAAKGYPGDYAKGTEIRRLSEAGAEKDVEIFHAGTQLKDGKILANGGRVLNVTARGQSVSQARDKAYEAIGKIDWPDGFCRRDIGWRAIEREKASNK